MPYPIYNNTDKFATKTKKHKGALRKKIHNVSATLSIRDFGAPDFQVVFKWR